MSDYKDRREARRAALSDLDVEAPLTIRNGKIALKIDQKSPLSVGAAGLQMNVDGETVVVVPGSPYRIQSIGSGTAGADGDDGTDGDDGADGADGSIVMSELIIASVASNPLVFADIVQNSGGTDLVYSS